MQPLRVMVTGAGSMVGQGIIKSLRISSIPLIIIAADNEPYYAGLYRADEATLIPKLEKENAYEEMVEILNRQNVDILFIGSEYDLDFFSQNKFKLEMNSNALIIVSDYETIQIANDKWLTVQFLKDLNLPYPLSFIPNDLDEALLMAEKLTFPLILKTRNGTSARDVYVVHTSQQLMQLFPRVKLPILQEMICLPKDELDSEYTCSIFKTKENEIIGPFNSRRVLKNGSSWVTEVKPFEFLNELLLAIASHLKFMGTLNVQIMDGKKGPVPFEINARSSGTTAIRSYFGFNEPKMIIENYYFNKKIEKPIIKHGFSLRYVEELFLNCNEFDENTLSMKAEKMDWF